MMRGLIRWDEFLPNIIFSLPYPDQERLYHP
jgi:hypothetical protein